MASFSATSSSLDANVSRRSRNSRMYPSIVDRPGVGRDESRRLLAVNGTSAATSPPTPTTTGDESLGAPPPPAETVRSDGDANATAAAALSAAVTGGIIAPAAPAASRALSGAVAAILAKPPRVSSPSSASLDATTSAPTSSCSSLSTATVAASRSARATAASSSATFAASETAASSDRAAASSSSAPSAARLNALTSSSSRPEASPEPPANDPPPVDGSTTAASCWTSRFTTGLFRMFLALAAYLSVLSVSSRLASAGDMHAIMHVRELPPSESCSSRVSLESRYGTCRCRGPRSCFRRSWSSAMALITLPRASRPLLMLMDSLNLRPDAPVRLFRSEPARSTR